jgi:hypothetical protein
MDDLRLRISFGDDTTALMRDVLADMDDATLDNLDVDWEPPQSPGLAGEPVSASVVLAGAAMAIAALLRLIERRMEHLQQREMMRIVAEGFDKHPKLGAQLEGMAKTYSQISISYGLAKEAWPPPAG